MKISVAQVRSIKGDIPANIATHEKLVQLAVSLKADAIFFPELSITSYEPELAKDLAVTPGDKRFDVFQEISDSNKICIGIGAPVKATAGTLISMIIFQPGKPIQLYSKQQLHSDELPYFVAGHGQTVLTIGNIKITPAICFESLQTNHAEHANELGANLYLASVAKSKNGVDKAMQHYPAIAKRFSMPVLMANLVGYCDNFESVGQSGAWNSRGELIAQLDDTNEGLLIFDTDNEKTIAQVLPLAALR